MLVLSHVADVGVLGHVAQGVVDLAHGRALGELVRVEQVAAARLGVAADELLLDEVDAADAGVVVGIFEDRGVVLDLSRDAARQELVQAAEKPGLLVVDLQVLDVAGRVERAELAKPRAQLLRGGVRREDLGAKAVVDLLVRRRKGDVGAVGCDLESVENHIAHLDLLRIKALQFNLIKLRLILLLRLLQKLDIYFLHNLDARQGALKLVADFITGGHVGVGRVALSQGLHLLHGVGDEGAEALELLEDLVLGVFGPVVVRHFETGRGTVEVESVLGALVGFFGTECNKITD